MKILINNKQGLNDHAKLNAALHEARGYDITMYQETKLRRMKLNHIRAKWGHDGVYMANSGSQKGRTHSFLTLTQHQPHHLDC